MSQRVLSSLCSGPAGLTFAHACVHSPLVQHLLPASASARRARVTALRRLGAAALVASALALALLGTLTPAAAQPAPPSNPRFFQETGFTVSNDAFWNYFQRRGGLRTFGYPTSRDLTLEGFRMQFFQRQVMQLRGDGSVALVNLLDSSVLPYTKMNGSTFPAVDQAILNAGPSPSDPAYGEKVVAFLRDRAPDSFNGKPVNFANTAVSLVRYEDAFPNAEGPRSLIPVINVLEISGLPSSAPTVDPNNGNFIYQRFQRLVLQYDAGTNTTQALLLADYLKAIITGQNLPADLEAQARESKYYRQYDRRRPNNVARPEALPSSDLTNAFEREDRDLPAINLGPKVSLDVRPENPAVGATFTVTLTASNPSGVAKVSWNAIGSGVPELDQVHDADCSGFAACVRSWNAVTRVPGDLRIRATAQDTSGVVSDEVRSTVTFSNTLQGALEIPANGARVGGVLTIKGWAADKAASLGTGVQAVHVYLDGEQNQGFFLGAATYGETREEIARQLGEDRFKPTGFSLNWDTTRVAPGDHVLNVYALSAATGRWEKFTSKVTVVQKPFADDPLIRVMGPTDGQTTEGVNKEIKGWAVDRNAPSGTGVDQVEVYLDGERGTSAAVKLGAATYGGNNGDPAQELGDTRFTNSGFTLTWNPSQFRPGPHTVLVYARSTYTDSWTVKRVPITIQ